MGMSVKGAPARDHCTITDTDGKEVRNHSGFSFWNLWPSAYFPSNDSVIMQIGEVTSGTFSPSLGKPIAMG